MANKPAIKRLSDADKAVDHTAQIQGHVSQNVRQVFTHERSRLVEYKPLLIEAKENIDKDQFGNVYLSYTSKLMDGEVYGVFAWVGTYRWLNATEVLVLVKEWKKFKTFNDSLIDAFRGLAFECFGRQNIAIMKARHAGKQLAVVSDRFTPPQAAA